MDKFFEFLNRYTFGFFNVTSAYCDWASRQATTQGELVMMALAPGVVAVLLLWVLPSWLAIPLAVVLVLPFLHIAVLVVRAMVQKHQEHK